MVKRSLGFHVMHEPWEFLLIRRDKPAELLGGGGGGGG